MTLSLVTKRPIAPDSPFPIIFREKVRLRRVDPCKSIFFLRHPLLVG